MAAELGAAEASRRLAQEEQIRREEEAKRARLADLTRRFGPEVAGRITRREIWVGQTAEQLVEARGRPVDMDEKVLKTKHVFKYEPTGVNRYALRITLDDGVVVGWDDKR